MSPLLEVRDLRITIPQPPAGRAVAVDGVSLTIERGELVALVGESGCGKSLTGLAIPALLPDVVRIGKESQVLLDGENLARLDDATLRRFRGARIAMIFQDPRGSLNPVMRVGDQVIEALTAHRTMSTAAARERAISLLDEVGIVDPASRVDAWPHELSGGMCQRVMIAIALAGEPDLLIADEPTTALDVTVQAQVLELLDRLRVSRGMAVLLITHDLGIVASRADRVLVMYAGRIVESAPTRALFRSPQHPYTQGLLDALPRLDGAERLRPIPGSVPPPARWPTGCRFHPRCPVALPRCGTDVPALEPVTSTHRTACWLVAREST